MSDTGPAFDDASSPPARSTPSEERQTPPAQKSGKENHSSIGACDACRARKVRCLANESSMSSKCQRCARANRDCIYTTHSKTRRRKRTDTRVKELEEKVRGLSMLLENGGKPKTLPSISENGIGSTQPDVGNSKQASIDGARSSSTGLLLPVKELSPYDFDGGANRLQTWELAKEPSFQNNEGIDTIALLPDVIDQGILSMAMAERLYARYLDTLVYTAPVVPLTCTAAELRREKPVLFLSIMAASAGSADPGLNLRLNQEIQQLYAKRVSIQGRKNLELIQALCVSIVWTYPPGKMEELKFHQQIQMAATMAMDIGLGKRPKTSRDESSWSPGDSDGTEIREQMSQRLMSTPGSRPDSGTLESRRTLLACYVFCTSVSMSLRLPNMLRFTGWMAECVEFLKASPLAAPTDKIFVAWVELQRVVEECAMSFGLDSDETASLADEHTQLKLKTTEKQLDSWRRNVLSDPILRKNPTLEISFHVNNVYLHEIALHPDHDAEDFRPPYSITSKPTNHTTITPAYINAILTCVSASESLLEFFTTIDFETTRALPTMAFARVIYTVVILMKLAISSRLPSSELSKIIDPQDIKVDHYLASSISHLGAATQLGNNQKHILSSQFLHILAQLKSWYEHSKRQQSSKTAQDRAISVMQGTDDALEINSMANCNTDPFPGASSTRLAQHDFDFSLPPTTTGGSNGSFFTNLGKGPNAPNVDGAETQSMQATTWPDQPNQPQQPAFNFSESESLFPSSNIPFDFPMEVDPNMFTPFVDSDMGCQGWMEMEGVGLDYGNVPEYNWGLGTDRTTQ